MPTLSQPPPTTTAPLSTSKELATLYSKPEAIPISNFPIDLYPSHGKLPIPPAPFSKLLKHPPPKALSSSSRTQGQCCCPPPRSLTDLHSPSTVSGKGGADAVREFMPTAHSPRDPHPHQATSQPSGQLATRIGPGGGRERSPLRVSGGRSALGLGLLEVHCGKSGGFGWVCRSGEGCSRLS